MLLWCQPESTHGGKTVIQTSQSNNKNLFLLITLSVMFCFVFFSCRPPFGIQDGALGYQIQTPCFERPYSVNQLTGSATLPLPASPNTPLCLFWSVVVIF